VFALTILLMGYSYRYYRRQLASGNVAPSPVSRRGIALVVLSIIARCVFTGWTLFSGSMNVNFGENGRYGSYTRYTHASCDVVIVLETSDDTIVLSDADESTPHAIYEHWLENVR